MFPAKEGFPFILGSLIVLLVLMFFPKCLLITLSLLTLLMMIWFFRDPERVTDVDDEDIVSAADGKVVEITQVTIDGKEFKKISVFMNVFSVHVNRAPYSGTISKVEHIDGSFIAASKNEASTENERCEIHFDTPIGPIIAVQVAGLVARRTVSYVKRGDVLTKGERIGMIKFSSRVDHYLPVEAKITVTHGVKVVAGVTTIATLDDDNDDD